MSLIILYRHLRRYFEVWSSWNLWLKLKLSRSSLLRCLWKIKIKWWYIWFDLQPLIVNLFLFVNHIFQVFRELPRQQFPWFVFIIHLSQHIWIILGFTPDLLVQNHSILLSFCSFIFSCLGFRYECLNRPVHRSWHLVPMVPIFMLKYHLVQRILQRL